MVIAPLVVMYAMFGQRVPQKRRKTVKRRTPARGPSGVIDDRIVVTIEHTETKAGGVTLEKDARSGWCSIRNAKSPSAGDAVGNNDAGQAGAVVERFAPDAGDAVRDRDVGQADAASRTHRSRC